MRIKIHALKKTCLTILTKKGLDKTRALLVFEEFLDGELRGRECHGFQSFPKFGAGLVDFEGEPKVLKEEDNLLYIDGKKNLGQIVCAEYVPKLIEKAKKKHIAMMGIFNMHSYLMPGTYARMAAENDVVGFIFNYGGWPRIAPTGSIDPIFGTNPIAVGIPSNDLPVVVDMSTARISMMKVRMAQKFGKGIPKGVAIDKNGNPTTDPVEAIDGALFPFDDYKGSALALIVEILTNTMFNIDIHDKTKANRGFFFAFFNPAVFQPIGEFKINVAELIAKIKNSRKAEGVAEIFFPGEQSERMKRANENKDHLDLDEKIINDIKALLDE